MSCMYIVSYKAVIHKADWRACPRDSWASVIWLQTGICDNCFLSHSYMDTYLHEMLYFSFYDNGNRLFVPC